MIRPIDRARPIHPGRLAIKARAIKDNRPPGNVTHPDPSSLPTSIDFILDLDDTEISESHIIERHLSRHWTPYGGREW